MESNHHIRKQTKGDKVRITSLPVGGRKPGKGRRRRRNQTWK